jgi:hypothetical protein
MFHQIALPKMTIPKAKSEVIRARIDAEILAAFDAQSASRGGRSAALRALVEASVEAQKDRDLLPRSDGSKSQRVQISLSETEMAVIDYRAAQRSINRAGWVKALVRRHLGLKQSKEDGLVEALLPIRSQLIRIGRNINQAMKAANVILVAGKNDSLAAELATITAMRAELNEQIAAVRSAMQGDYSYWVVPE